MSEKEQISIESQDISPRAKKLAWWVFLLFGITVLLPFNCFIVPVDYWFNQFPSTLLTAISVTNNIFNSIVTFIMMKFSYTLTVRFRILVSLTIWLVVLLIVPFAQLFSHNQTTRMTIILICVAFAGCANGLFFPTAIGVAASLDVSFIAAFNAGSGIAGIVAQVLKVITKPIIPFNSKAPTFDSVLYYTTVAYYIIAAIFVLVTYFAYFWLVKNYGADKIEFDAADRQKYFTRDKSAAKEVAAPGTTFFDAVKNLWMPGVSLFLIFFVTLTLFPAITIQILCYSMFKTNESGKYGDWWSIIMFSWFMVGDWVGRQFPSWKWGLSIWNVKTLFIAAIVRLAFIALFIIQIVPYYHWPAGTASPAAAGTAPDGLPLVHNDLVAWIVMILFAVSNGWFMCAIFCKYGSIMKPETNGTHAANFMTLCLNMGLLFGSSLGTVVSIIIDSAKASLG
ncbi:Nucleoside transporter [Spironucleus salmonicida]|uniref:Nucleoside transporter n=3 Tax=Spironucleus salmonicida TaxID=348837 RepID=A0A9P8LX55_9EUKA|nr:Nucleoside transporter [Spironucleus salmonicida]